MKRIIVLFMMIILSIVLVGCNVDKKVKVEFKMKNICKVVETLKSRIVYVSY